MYGVPGDLNLEPFFGATLNQICLGPFDLQFRFSRALPRPAGRSITPTESASVQVEGSWRLEAADGSAIDESIGRVADAGGNRSRMNWAVRSLLTDIVVSGTVDAPRSFTLMFASGRRLTIFDDSEHYESFSVQPGDVFV
jgi:hypothetical protein